MDQVFANRMLWHLPYPEHRISSRSRKNSDQSPFGDRRCIMRNHDFVSDGFLALIATSLVMLCSGLLIIALS